MTYFPIHSTINAAIAAVGEVSINASWKQTANQSRKERSVCIPMECVKAPEVPESFRALVESCLMASAEETLKSFVNDQPNNYQISSNLFDRPQLVESFLSKSDSWMSKESLETAFTGSRTWNRIVSRSEFASNVTYQNAANAYKDNILKLSAKPTHLPKEIRDQIIAKMESDDLNTEMGSFIIRRFEQMGKKDSVQTVSFADL